MKKHKECNKCQYFVKDKFRDMGASTDGCKLLQYHKDYGLWGCLFDGETKESCKYYEPKENLKDKFKKILGDDFFDELPDFDDL